MIRRASVTLALALTGAACHAPAGHVEHVVLLWLKEPDSVAHVQRVIDTSLELRAIPGVLDVVVGPPIPSQRGIVDDSFTLCLLFTMEDEAALERYVDHPLHERAKEEVLAPLVERIQVYDFMHAGAGAR